MTQDRFFVAYTNVYEHPTARLVQAFTTKENADYYAEVLNRKWKEGKIK